MPYINPGDAANGAIQNLMVQQEQQKHAAFLDQLALTREQRMQQAEQAIEHDRQQKMHDYVSDREEERLRKKAEQTDKTAKDFTADIEKRYLPGDYASAEDIARAQQLGVQLPGGIKQPDTPAQPMVGPQAEGVEPGSVMTDAVPGGIRMSGSAQQRLALQQKEQLDAVRNTLSNAQPNSPEYRKALIDYGMLTGKPLTAAEVSGGSNGQAVMRVDSSRKVAQRLIDGQWVDQTGDVPKDAHWIQEPAPAVAKDTSATDASHLQHAYDGAMKEFLDVAKPIQGHLEGVNSLGQMLNARTPQADSLIAPLVLKATVSGQGSGFRMTRAEIDNVMHSRSKWQDLEAALNKWSLDPSQALQVTDEQRGQLRDLAKAIRDKATKQMTLVSTARHALDDATDPAVIKKLRTKLQDDLAAMDVSDDTVDSGASAGLPAVGSTFNGAKVLSVTPVTKK